MYTTGDISDQPASSKFLTNAPSSPSLVVTDSLLVPLLELLVPLLLLLLLLLELEFVLLVITTIWDSEANVYYYTPLPLNLANKQAASKQQALLLSVLAIAPPHRSGLYSTLAILEPKWWPCQIQVLSQKLTGGGPGRGRQVGRCPPKSAHVVPQNSLLWPKMALIPVKMAKQRETVATLHVCLNCPVTKSRFLPSSSTICPRTGPNMAKNGLNVRCLCQTSPKPRTGRILGSVAQNRIPRAPIPPATPHFLWFPSFRIAQRDA